MIFTNPFYRCLTWRQRAVFLLGVASVVGRTLIEALLSDAFLIRDLKRALENRR